MSWQQPYTPPSSGTVVDFELSDRQYTPPSAGAVVDFDFQSLITGETTYTIDSIIKNTLTPTFTVDTVVVHRRETTFTSDAILKLTNTDSFTTDAMILKVGTLSVTGDAVIKQTSTIGFTADCILIKSQFASIDIDTVLKTINHFNITVDGLISGFNKSFSEKIDIWDRLQSYISTDALIGIRHWFDFTIDTIVLKHGLTSAFTADEVVAPGFGFTFNIDALIRDTFTDSFTIDTVIPTGIGITFDTDAIVQDTFSSSFTIDAVPEYQRTHSFSIDTVIPSTFDIDAIILKLAPYQFLADTIVAFQRRLPFSIDTNIFKTTPFGLTIDAVLQSTFEQNWTADAIVVYQRTSELTIDTVIISRSIYERTIDAVLKEILSQSITIDALVASIDKSFSEKIGIADRWTYDRTIDAVIRQRLTSDFSIDTLIARITKGFSEKIDIVYTHTIDAIVLKTQEDTFSIDTIVVNRYTPDFLADSIVQDTFYSSFTVDTVLQEIKTAIVTGDCWIAIRPTTTAVIDAVFAYQRYTSFTIDTEIITADQWTIDGINKFIEQPGLRLFSVFQKTEEIDFTIDNIIRAYDFSFSEKIDVWERVGVPFTVDCAIQKPIVDQFDIYVFVREVGTKFMYEEIGGLVGTTQVEFNIAKQSRGSVIFAKQKLNVAFCYDQNGELWDAYMEIPKNEFVKIPATARKMRVMANDVDERNLSVGFTLAYNSTLTSSETEAEETGAKGIVSSMNDWDKGAVIKFGKDVKAKSYPTTNKAWLNTVIDATFDGDSSGVAVYDAIYDMADILRSETPNGDNRLIVVSNAPDDSSTKTLKNVLDFLVAYDIKCYCIGLNLSGTAETNMRQIAEASQGKYYAVSDASGIATAFDTISGLIVSNDQPIWTTTEEFIVSSD